MKTDWLRVTDKMLDTSQWESFLLSEIFVIKKGKRLTKENQIPGDTIFIGATSKNNGITANIGQAPIFRGNAISLTYNGSIGEAFYQKDPFWASDDVNVLYPKDFLLTENIALFLCAILRFEGRRWSYGRKWNLDNMNQTSIRLPATKEKKIDIQYIESYMSSFHVNLNDIPDYFLNEGYERANWFLDNIDQNKFENEYANRKSFKTLNLNQRRWKKFKFSDLFQKIDNTKTYNAGELTEVFADDYINYITRTDQNNGVSMCVQSMDYEGLEKAGAITIGDTTATAFYQDHDFITGPHIIVVRADWLNVYTASFIITLLNQEKYRYPVFGRAFTKDLIKDTLLRLPIDEDGNPDYKFMEEYIKSLPYSQNIQ